MYNVHKRGDSLYILLSLPICQRTAGQLCPKWKPEGLDLSAGPVPVFPSVWRLHETESCSTIRQAHFPQRTSQYQKSRHLLSCEVFTDLPGLAAGLRHSTPLQKGGVPAAPSGTATLLRLSPNHQFCLRPILAVTDFRHPRLSWLDGRCVQGPGTYSPRHG